MDVNSANIIYTILTITFEIIEIVNKFVSKDATFSLSSLILLISRTPKVYIPNDATVKNNWKLANTLL